MRFRSASLSVLTGLLAALVAARATAQFDQYRPPGGLVEPPADRKGTLDKATSEARWHLGPVRLSPWWELRDIQYVDNAVGGPGPKSGDLTGTAGAGLRAYFRTGPKIYWAVHALPEYVWWREAADRRRVDGRYGIGVFGFWNRLTVEATGQRTQAQSFVSPEVTTLSHARNDRATLSFDLRLSGRFALFASGEDLAVRNLVSAKAGEAPLDRLDRLDRDESVVRGGLRYRLGRGFTVGAGVERDDIDFIAAPLPLDRSNRGTSPFVLVRQQNEDRFFEIEVASRSSDPKAGSSFVPFDATTANLSAGFNQTGRIAVFAYGGRGIVYTLDAGYSYLQDDRIGGALLWKVGIRTRARAYFEFGRNDYRAARPGTPRRSDDTLSYGASADFSTGRHGSFGLHFGRTDFRSNLPGFDRSITAIGAGYSFRSGSTGWY